ncbi:MAG: DNA helicase RecG, partial [Aquificae bacterium]|nr:DNA helicase RecG [Aquificota bacterium]
MKNLKKAKAILERLKGYDDKLLERTTGLSDTLSQLLESYITPAILEDLKQIDTLTLPKKKAFIDYLYKLINELESKIKPKEEKKQIEQLPLSDFFTKKLSSLNILKPIEKRAFKKVGVETVYDALFFTPKKYEDRRLKKLSQLKDGDTALLKLTVEDIKKIKKGKLKVKVVLRQGNVKINAYFVHDKPFLFTFFRKGKEVYLFGKVSKYGKEISMVQPQIFNEFDPIIMDRIVPVYSLRGDSSVKTTSQTINHLRRGV